MIPDQNVFISSFYYNDHSLNTGDEVVNQNRPENCLVCPVIKSMQPDGHCLRYFDHILEKPKVRNKQLC
jgi:hypothetical protein